MTRIGIVTGMESEAALALAPSEGLPEPFRPKVFVSGAQAARAHEGARQFVIDGIDALLSFGLAGGLDPDLRTGDTVLARWVALPDGTRVETDAGWRERTAEALAGKARVALAGIAGVDAPVTQPADKATLKARSAAVAVDMESHAVARAAREAGLPFLVARVILDGADRAIPWSALAGIDAAGRTRAIPVLARLLVKPWEVPALIGLGRANRAALASLGRLAADLGPTFVFGP